MHAHASLARIILAAFLIAVTAAVASAADLSGTWEVDGDVQGHAVKYTGTFEQQGQTLSGTARLADGREVAVTGTVDDTKASWTFEVDGYVLTFSGTVDSDDDMKGTIEVSGAWGDFTAKRQAGR